MLYNSHLFVEQFSTNIYICGWNEGLRLIKKWYPDYEVGESCDARCLWFPKHKQIFILFKLTTPDIIAHECFHAVNFLLRDRMDCRLDDNTEEVYAYFNQWLVQKVNETIKGKLKQGLWKVKNVKKS